MSGDGTFGGWLRQRRKELGYTQDELAKLANCSGATIRKLEAGNRRPSEELAATLAARLELLPDEIEAFLRLARGEGATPVQAAPTASPAQAPTASTQAAVEASTARDAAVLIPNNLPVPLTPLLGREAEVEVLHKSLLRPDVRLVTLVGPPGIGKTRLAVSAARGLASDFPDGVYFVALAPISDPRLVDHTIAQVVGLQETTGQSLLQHLINQLRDKKLLLLLDNFEQVVESAPLIVDLLAGCPGMTALVTSREALRTRGERQFQVPPLPLPDLAAPTAREVRDNPAVALFVERAQATRPDFELTDENAGAVATLCARLDGLPLAIELAAARVRLLTPAAILERLDSRLKLLTGGPRDLPRHQTLRAAIAWSYDLLDEGEKKLFARLGVFTGGCSLSAIEAVCNATEDLPFDILEGMESLLDKNLVRQEILQDEMRFTMLEMIREFALERLEEAGEYGALHRLHAEYYLALVEGAEPEMRGALQEPWMRRLEMEHDNIRSLLKWAIESGRQEETEMALRMAGVLWLFWEIQNHLSEGRRWLEQALERSTTLGVETAPRARAVHGASRLAWMQGDREQARRLAEESAVLWSSIGGKQGLAQSMHNIAVISGDMGEFSTARASYDKSLALWRELGNRGAEARVLNSMGVLALMEGQYERAEALFKQALPLQQELGSKRSVGMLMTNLGHVMVAKGNLAAAEDFYKQGMEHRRALGIKIDIVDALTGFAALRAESDPLWAARLVGAVERMCDTMGYALEPSARMIYDPAVAAVRERLGPQAFARANAEGKALSQDEAIDYSLRGSTV